MVRIPFACAFVLAAATLPATAAWAQQAAPASPATAQSPPAPVQQPAAELVNVVLHTTMGDILLALDRAHAPLTADNFLHYVDQKRFDGIAFYRAVKIDEEGKYGLVQAGLRGNPKRLYAPIAHESPRTTGLSHVDGALSMAREAPGTADADFFIVVGDLVALDGQPTGDDPGYAVFGRVLAGMDVVRAMLELPRDQQAGEGVMQGQMLAGPVRILAARRAD
jgi:peptidyl-prolyl cis-trans isomerase A (cyclophilin A)